jgi:hypothetical protein
LELSQTPPEDYLRGWAKVSVMLFAFLNLAALLKTNRRRILFYLLGVTCAPLLSLALYGALWSLHKFYIGIPISISAFLFAGCVTNKWRILPQLAPFVAGGLALILNSRSIAGMTLVAAVYCYFKTGQRSSKVGATRTLLNAAAIAVAGFCILAIYTKGAPRGWLGEEAQEKYETQAKASESGEFSLLSGRSELLFSWPKIAASPIIGYGSWAKDVPYLYQRCAELNMLVDPLMIESGLIPAHSHFFGAWLEAGILGACFWGMVAWRSIKQLTRGSFACYGRIAPAIVFMVIYFLWDILFSPFGGDRRVHNAFMLWIITYPLLIKQKVKRRSEEAETSGATLVFGTVHSY